MSFSGSSLWDLFSDETVSLEKTYSKAIRIMWNLPLETHRYLIEPISGQIYLKFVLIKRFLRFKNQVFRSSKSAMKYLFSICEKDCRSLNLKNIMLLCEKDNIESISISDLEDLKYFPVPENESWRVNLLKELLDSRLESMEIPGFSQQELTNMIDFVCVS